jgi:hypothetical protein
MRQAALQPRQREGKTMRVFLAFSLAALLGTAASTSRSQTAAPPLPPLPSGFQADPGAAAAQAPMRAAGTGDGISGKKVNASMSDCFTDPKITFGYGWMLNPAAKTMIDILLKTPQDPATTTSGVLDEPISKQPYRGGVLEWRKQTWPIITGHPCKDSHVIFYEGKWMGYAGDRLISIALYNLYNSKDSGQGWIDDYIGKLGGLGSK